MPVHHVKGQPAASTYVREKGGVKNPVDLWTPCSYGEENSDRISGEYQGVTLHTRAAYAPRFHIHSYSEIHQGRTNEF